MSGHALLSPSSASRWLVCTPSARAAIGVEDTAGDAAKEGTLAHALAELLLKFYDHKLLIDDYKKQVADLLSKDAYINDNDELVQRYHDASMDEYVSQYASFVMEKYNEFLKVDKDAKLYVERKLDLGYFIPEGFGTGDVGIISSEGLHVIDLKYGKGVEVSAENNSQMKIYALGWLYNFYNEVQLGELQADFNIHMTIYQPRMDNISTYTISAFDLIVWKTAVLKPKAAEAFEGSGPYVPGKHCQFCKVKLCAARADYEMSLAKYQERSELSDEEVSEILSKADSLATWLKGIKEYALNEAVHNNKTWPGFKLVEGKSVRAYTDETKVAETLVLNGLPKSDLYEPPKLLGITKMEKLLGKKAFAEYLKGLVVKPPGALTLVPDEDKRTAHNSLSSAIEDFS